MPKKNLETPTKLISFRAARPLIRELERVERAMGEDKSALIRKFIWEGVWRAEAQLGLPPPEPEEPPEG